MAKGMAAAAFDSADTGFFCENIAAMLSAGIQVDEALGLLADQMNDQANGQVNGQVADAAAREAGMAMYRRVAEGATLSRAMDETGLFPHHAINTVRVGEETGRVQEALQSLAAYYAEEERMFAKVRAAVGYPAALLCVMAAVLAVTVLGILPTFFDVYQSMAGSLTGGSVGAVGVSSVIGWLALVLTGVCAVAALALTAASRAKGGRGRVLRLLERLPFTRGAMEQLAESRFFSMLSSYVAAGLNDDDALARSCAAVEHKEFALKAQRACALLADVAQPCTLPQALEEAGVLNQVEARMLAVRLRAGSFDATLGRFAADSFEEAMTRIDVAIDHVEPALAALMTIAVGAALIAVMMPLIGIMGSIG